MTRMATAQRSEAATKAKLEELGNIVEPYGQALLTDAARKLLRGVPTLDRWLPDFLVKTVSGSTVLVDAKYSNSRNNNHSIEMRALLAAHREGFPVWYVCSFHDKNEFYNFKAINAVSVPTTRPCCWGCSIAWHSSADAQIVNSKLPDYCPNAQVDNGSQTPYWIINYDAFPTTGDPFGILPPATELLPCKVCGGLVPPQSKWPDCHPACHQWPNSGNAYGPR